MKPSRAQREVLIAACNSNDAMLYSMPQPSINVMKKSGWIIRLPRHPVADREYYARDRDALIAEAKQKLAEHDWKGAYMALRQASYRDAAINETAYFITDAGRQAVNGDAK